MNNKKTTKKHHALADLFAGLTVFALLAGLIAAPRLTLAASGTKLYLSPASQSVTNGSNIVISIVVDTGGESINTVQSVISYSPSNFSLVGITPGSAFGDAFPNSAGSSSVQFTAGSQSAVTGVQTVARITLHAIGGGTSPVNLAALCPAGDYSATCSHVYSTAAGAPDVLSAVSGGNFTVASTSTNPTPSLSPSPSPSPPPTGGTSSGSTSSGSSQPIVTSSSPAATTTTNPAPVISDFAIGTITENSATITWTTNIPATSLVQYGLTDQLGQTAQADGLSTSHVVTLSAPSISQGTTYYVQVVSASDTGASSASAIQKFTTTGFTVTLVVLDDEGKPIQGATVTIGDKSLKTDAAGQVSLTDIPAGSQEVIIKAGIATTKRTITVGQLDPATGTYAAQKFSLSATRGKNLNPFVISGLAIVLFVLAGLLKPGGRLRDYVASRSAGPGDGPGVVGSGFGGPSKPAPPSKPAGPINPVKPAPVVLPHSESPALTPSTIITPDAPEVEKK